MMMKKISWKKEMRKLVLKNTNTSVMTRKSSVRRIIISTTAIKTI